MSQTKSGIVLADGERLVLELEAELWAISANPIAQVIGEIKKVIASILGFKKKGFLVITDKRVIEVSVQVACYIFTVGRQVKYVLPSSVKEIGYNRKASFGCFCPTFYLYYDAHTQCTSIQLKGAEEADAIKAANAFYDAIAAAN